MLSSRRPPGASEERRGEERGVTLGGYKRREGKDTPQTRRCEALDATVKPLRFIRNKTGSHYENILHRRVTKAGLLFQKAISCKLVNRF